MIAVCPDQNRLRQFSLGQLDEEQSDLLFTHVSDCPECQQQLEEDNDLDDSLTGQLRETAADGSMFSKETECKAAMTKALAVLANVQSNDSIDRSNVNGEFPEQKLPEKIGDYEIVRMIGRGGMGNVYLARHSKLGREVALKVIAAHRAGDPVMHGRFESELRAVGKLDHPNVVQALDAREEDGVVILVTEYIDGMDLGEIVRRVGPLNPADAASIVSKVAQALVAIDEAGMVHRDIKPSNIMISTDGQVKLLDLGLARLQGDGANREFTMTGQAIGTVDYLAPEQINGKGAIDIRTDIYGLGCTLFKLLTGEVPFGGPDHSTSFAKMTAHVSATRPTIVRADVPKNLVSLTHSMMSVNPSDRPAVPAMVSEAVDELAQQANLSTLIKLARETSPNRLPVETENPNENLESKLAPQPWWKRPVPLSVAIASGLFGLLIGMLLSIIITIKHPDGTVTKMEVPDGSHVTIDSEGNANVDLSNGSGNGTTGNTSNESTTDLPADNFPYGPDPDDLLGHLNGIWTLRLAGRQTNPAHGPNLMVFGGNKVAIYNNNRLMMEGTATPLVGMTSNLLLSRRLDPTSRPDEKHWFPTRIEASAIFIRTKDSVEIRDFVVPGEPESDRRFQLQRVKFDVTVADFPKTIANEVNTQKYSGMIAAMRFLYENEFGEMTLADSALLTLQRELSKQNLRELILGLHNFHFSRKLFPASRNTYDGTQFYSRDLSRFNESELQQHDSRKEKRSITDLGPGERPTDLHKPKNEDDSRKDTTVTDVSAPFSWRVAILPFIGQQALYDQYRFNERWDSDHNSKLLKQMPDIFRHPGDPEGTVETRFLGIAGDHSSLGLGKGTHLERIKDGTTRSIFLIEARDSIPWTKPEDVLFDPDNPAHPSLDWFNESITNAAFCDASVHTLDLSVENAMDLVRQMLTTDGGEVFDWNSEIFQYSN